MDYSGVNAKIKSMSGHLLKYDDYVNLSKLSSVEEVGNKLKDYQSYTAVMEKLEDTQMHRNIIEQKLFCSLTEDFSRIYKFISDYKLKKFMSEFFMRNEIHILKLIMCMIYDRRDIDYSIPELNSLLGSKFNIDISKLKSSKNMSEFINNLCGTEFYDVLKEFCDKEFTLFDVEMKLDLYYYMHVWDLENKYLSGRNKEIFKAIHGTDMDLKNIMWIYRLKSFYNIEPRTVIYSYLIPRKYKLTSEDIDMMVKAADRKDLLNHILNTRYFKEFAGKPSNIESIYYNIMNKIYRKSCSMGRNTLANVAWYIFAKELEIKNITSLLEGVRYGLPSSKILDYLFLNKEVKS